MDIIDVKILEVLQSNSRVSISELSKKVNLSLSAVSERLKKLESSNVIEKYTVILNSQALDKELSVIMNISLENPHQTSEFRTSSVPKTKFWNVITLPVNTTTF